MRVRFVDDCFYFFHRHLVLIDELDDIDSRISQCLNFRASIIRAFHSPTGEGQLPEAAARRARESKPAESR